MLLTLTIIVNNYCCFNLYYINKLLTRRFNKIVYKLTYSRINALNSRIQTASTVINQTLVDISTYKTVPLVT